MSTTESVTTPVTPTPKEAVMATTPITVTTPAELTTLVGKTVTLTRTVMGNRWTYTGVITDACELDKGRGVVCLREENGSGYIALYPEYDWRITTV